MIKDSAGECDEVAPDLGREVGGPRMPDVEEGPTLRIFLDTRDPAKKRGPRSPELLS
jgi:hypothetical protein